MKLWSMSSWWAAGLMLGGLVQACTDDAEVTPGACEMVIDACHPKDDGSDDMINGCHSRAHEGDDAVCSTDLQACLDYCNAAPPVGGHAEGEETGHHEDSGDTGSSGGGEGSGTGGDETTGGAPATSSTGADDASDASCDELGSICHDSDDEFGMMCHDVGHEGDEMACAAIWVQCLEVCL